MPPRLLLALIYARGPRSRESWCVLCYQGQLPPADFTFNNETEIESLDPAVVTGQPEGRIIDAFYEGLVRLGTAEAGARSRAWPTRWEVSEDGRTYTFHLRKDAKWSDGSPSRLTTSSTACGGSSTRKRSPSTRTRRGTW